MFDFKVRTDDFGNTTAELHLTTDKTFGNYTIIEKEMIYKTIFVNGKGILQTIKIPSKQYMNTPNPSRVTDDHVKLAHRLTQQTGRYHDPRRVAYLMITGQLK